MTDPKQITKNIDEIAERKSKNMLLKTKNNLVCLVFECSMCGETNEIIVEDNNIFHDLNKLKVEDYIESFHFCTADGFQQHGIWKLCGAIKKRPEW